jgi:pullulanase/glycogen debranching enzyme
MSEADWNDSNLRAVAVLLNGASTRSTPSSDLLIVFNADEAPVDIRVPPPSGAKWTVVFDTSLDAPASAARSPAQDAPVHVGERSVMLLETVATQADEP